MKRLYITALTMTLFAAYTQHAAAGEGSYNTTDLNAEAREIVGTEKTGFTEEDAKRTAAEAIIFGRYVDEKNYRGSLFGVDERMHRRQLNRSKKFLRSMK